MRHKHLYVLQSTGFVAIDMASPLYEMACKMFDRGSLNPVLAAIVASPQHVFVSIERDKDSAFTVCHILFNGRLYTGVSKRMVIDKDSELGVVLAFRRALLSQGADIQGQTTPLSMPPLEPMYNLS